MNLKVNIKWIKQNLVILVFLPIFIAFAVMVVLAQRKASVRRAEASAAVEAKQVELQGFVTKKPFRSKENIDFIRQDHERLEQVYQTMLQMAGRGTITTPDLAQPFEFADMMLKKLQRLRFAASDAGVALPQPGPFYFGFSQYASVLPAHSTPRDRVDEIRRLLATLSKQLLVVERVSDILISNRVERIGLVRRVEPEKSGGSSDALDGAISDDPNALYNTMPFEFQFACNTDALRGVLNSLSQSDWFFATRLINVETETVGGSSGTPDPVTGIVNPATVAPARRRLVVTMRLDLVEFPSAKPKPSA